MNKWYNYKNRKDVGNEVSEITHKPLQAVNIHLKIQTNINVITKLLCSYKLLVQLKESFVYVFSIYFIAIINKLRLIPCENRSVRFHVSYDKSNCIKSVIYPASLTLMNRFSVLSANFDSTVLLQTEKFYNI